METLSGVFVGAIVIQRQQLMNVFSVVCQEVDALNQKFDESGAECKTNRTKFKVVCLKTDMLILPLLQFTTYAVIACQNSSRTGKLFLKSSRKIYMFIV